jgi:hypothetical protein
MSTNKGNGERNSERCSELIQFRHIIRRGEKRERVFMRIMLEQREGRYIENKE